MEKLFSDDDSSIQKHPIFSAAGAPLSLLYGKNEAASAARCRPLCQLIVGIIPAKESSFSFYKPVSFGSADASLCSFHTELADWII